MKQKSLLSGVAASISLLLLYAIIMSLLNGWKATIGQLQALWYLMVPISIGFGIQVGLYTELKKAIRDKAKATLTASGTTASISMLACCAHHATDVLPILGLSGVSVFLTSYQKEILIISLGVNLVGIFIMFKHLKKVKI